MIWRSLDFHKDGTVNYTEFLAASLSASFFLKEDKLKFVFNFFDEQNKQFITPKQIIDGLKNQDLVVNNEEILKRFDGNMEFKIDFLNFKKIMEDDTFFFSSNSTYG